MNDIFKNYGLDNIDDKTPLSRETTSTTCKFDDTEYRKLVLQQDKEIDTIQSRYLNARSDESLDSILRDLGYDYDLEDELMYLKPSGDYTLFIDLERYEYSDEEDNYLVYGVVDCDNKIPKGYCATKYKLQEPSLYEDACDTSIGCNTNVRKDFINSALESKYNF